MPKQRNCTVHRKEETQNLKDPIDLLGFWGFLLREKTVQLKALYPELYCNIFINSLDDGTRYTLNRFANDTKLGGGAEAPEGHAAIKGPRQAGETG